jgi:hypothetical protein
MEKLKWDYSVNNPTQFVYHSKSGRDAAYYNDQEFLILMN